MQTVATPIGPNNLSVNEAAVCLAVGGEWYWGRRVGGSGFGRVGSVCVCLSCYDVKRPMETDG